MSKKNKALTTEEIKQRMKLVYERKKLLDSIEESIVIQLCEAGVTVSEAKIMMRNISESIAFCADRICMIDAMRDEYEDLRSERDGSAPLPVKTSSDVVDDFE